MKCLRYVIFFCLTFSACLVGTGQSLPGKMNDVVFVSELDGTMQHYVEMLPGGFDKEKKYDLLIGLHGHGSDRWQFAKDKRSECASFRDFAARHQMIAVSPDYRAKTSWMGPAAEKDMVQIIRELQRKYRINRVFLVGGSMGGTAALTFAAIHPDLIDGVTSMNGLANHFEYDQFQDAIAASFGGSKPMISLEYKKRSAEYWPEKLVMPIAFTMGKQDSVVPPESVMRLANVLQILGRQVLLNVDETGGHETGYKDAYDAMEFMWEKANKR